VVLERRNMKAYIVGKYDSTSDGITVGVYLDKEKCEKDIAELNKPHDAETILYEECLKCSDHDYGCNKQVFKLRNECKRQAIKTDRNGEYCENDLSDYYSMKTERYYINETELLG
jgi:hypothetical protein